MEWMLWVLVMLLLVDLWVTVRQVHRLEDRVGSLERRDEPEQVEQ